MKKASLTVVILTYNEKLHIARAIECVSNIAERIVVVDSFSKDGTNEIAQYYNVGFYQREFVNQAEQFNWALDNCGIDTEWVLRLDADEVLGSDLIENIEKAIRVNDSCSGYIFKRKHIFLGRWIRFGGRYPVEMIRLFQFGKGRSEERWMDEHIVLSEGSSRVLEGHFEDHNLNSITWFVDKHNKYATREMLDIKLAQLNEKNELGPPNTSLSVKVKRFIKQNIYGKLPVFVRPTLYFLYRYFFQLGFLDGKEGFAYHFMQGYWYRALVDLKCLEADRVLKNCNSFEEKIEALEGLTGYSLKDITK